MRRCLLLVFLILCVLPGAAHAAGAGSTLLVDRPDGFGDLPFDAINYSSLDAGNAISDDAARREALRTA